MDEQKIDQIIQKLKSLDLSLYPKAEIHSLFQQLGNIPVLITTLNPGQRIIRGRTYNEGDDFSQIKHHSYKPKELNDQYQRASIPNQTMFYGSVTSEESEEPLARVTILTEIGNTLRKQAENETVMFSAWEVTEKIDLLSIIQCGAYEKPNQQMLYLEHRFNNEFKDENGRKFVEYIASEFAKKDTSLDYNYMISALFSYLVCQKGLDGIYYPSVRVGGEGMNVAIKPEVADSHLVFVGAAECKVIKEGMNITVHNEKKAIFKNDGTLNYVPIEEKDYIC